MQPQAGAAALARRRVAAAAQTATAEAGQAHAGHVTAACPNQVWALDFLVDQTADGRPIKILTVTDEHTREALATTAARRLGADDTVNILERIVERRGTAPALIRCDNGPELVAHALKDWCRFTGVQTGYIEPGAPWQNPFIESFNGHLRRELLDLESFNTLYEAQLLLDDWQLEYNHYRPHQSLNYQPPPNTPDAASPKGRKTDPDSHNTWTEKWGPVSVICRLE
jgi:transposase InsO family protein